MKSKIAILNSCEENLKTIDENLLSKLPYDATIYSHTQCNDFCNEIIPAELDTIPKMFNFIIKQEKSKPDHPKYLNIVLDAVKLDKDPTEFLEALQNMMQKLNLKSWFNTSTDMMNYVFAKYVPLFCVAFNEDDAKTIGTQQLIFTSHANVSWICLDLDADIDEIKFNEDLSFAMYYIVEYLARRAMKTDQNSLNFMNMYPTVPQENGVFHIAGQIVNETNKDKIQKDSDVFNALKLDVSPMRSIDVVLEHLYNIIESKK